MGLVKGGVKQLDGSPSAPGQMERLKLRRIPMRGARAVFRLPQIAGSFSIEAAPCLSLPATVAQRPARPQRRCNALVTRIDTG